ncbi:hypothetical protein ARMGADRAFT_1020478 [Armillaria gallica]|uniref:Uncharacterized protein n=1 Tax=Armillaria gallica TaxID=47427 RepID=A0A2H3CWT1_ARMGA|nr:hypothetical protein ARMGADRAFT_1020478 [Armillaria gallica]
MSTAENFLLMQKCSALYVKDGVPNKDDFNLKNIKSCGMNATGNATTAYPKCYDAAPCWFGPLPPDYSLTFHQIDHSTSR